ncbi:MAG: type II secretion system F family protein [Alphaproteobacteria bacterium]|nr:type II secretion system F family protein [Alphaproteobacteria bacterium]
MQDMFQRIVDLAGGGIEFAVLSAVFAGVMMTIIGARGVLAHADPIGRRLDQQHRKRDPSAPLAIRRGEGAMPVHGLRRFITPADPGERRQVEQQLMRAGFRSEQAVISYYFIRAVLGFLLPLPLVLGSLAMTATAESGARLPIVELDMTGSMGIACTMLLIGFYGPPIWLRRRIAARQRAIRHGFPHALDMMQVAIEAGLGFDSALARVAGELKHAHPALAEEFLIVGLELRAGKGREQVLADLADRTQVDAVAVFTKAIMQSIALGTSVASTLQVYAREMRHQRTLMAEERANQLPVKMSVIMVVFLLPTIFLMALSPVIIRLVRMFAGGALSIG